jgi:hypothetical protein
MPELREKLADEVLERRRILPRKPAAVTPEIELGGVWYSPVAQGTCSRASGREFASDAGRE